LKGLAAIEEGPVAVVMLVVGHPTAEPVVGPEAAERLARLGVTRISLLADRSGVGVVLEGWAFDPADIAEAVRAMFPDGGAGVRIFHEIEHVAVSVASGEGRT
jgi:hypothetical protein